MTPVTLRQRLNGWRRPRLRSCVVAVVAAVVFVFSWLLRFNDPDGSFAGLTDDHFFYVVRGWQILFGDLPVRDFVDHGAPLFYYVAYAVQQVFGRGTLSELMFCTTVLSIGAAGTYWLATIASGWIPIGLGAAVLHVWLAPRFYNYPKVVVYVAAIPLLWWFVDKPGPRPRFWIALVTAIAFLFRHDHGVFVALAMATVLVSMSEMPWAARARHALVYGLIVLALLTPYLLFIQWNGGLRLYFSQASAWAERDRDRAPVVWPGLFDNPDGVSDEARTGGPVARAIATVRDNKVAWLYYTEILLPCVALLLLAASRDGFRPTWPRARSKLVLVAVLAAILDAGFLRSPLAARLADPSVPIVLLVGWLCVALASLVRSSGSLNASIQRFAWPVRLISLSAGAVVVAVIVAVVSGDLYERLDKSGMTDRFGKPFERVTNVANQVRLDWDLASWVSRSERPELVTLSLYVNACTAANDRVLVQAYLPQVLALARRAFAGGHADLRPGFFKTEEAQRQVLDRLQRQSVPLILLETEESLRGFRESFPIVFAYIEERYRVAATRVFDGRFGVTLFVRKDLTPTSNWAPLDWPCYGSGRIGS
jgi:hypothetical protein